mmetsp:Transcript_30130/g.63870  ORF Transcript_30130/g.63870 Transcript_30130/m.63870 type:complete len:266 (-) Transcript_30130:265-1062(-)|eukprot:CAMPEP_0172309716 /NCGR_PEP_ID=MMETSP1058-20130122/10507_1 /TAXON_ID=83371 /ORGANISM="Detonula confervacea, Strain CCMP 353" /LENGTH=265 /DNA_ID=CAMNT_0013022391 /DNA_START=63 /DNA_END=860 /DNA_ORIENTATION=+
MDSVANTLTSRDDIMQQIASHAASVRRTFEAHPSKRKHTVSSATAAAAQHMASLNRKRKFENNLAIRATDAVVCADQVAPKNIWKQKSHTFHSPIASFTRPEKSRQVSSSSSSVPVSVHSAVKEPAAPRVSDGIVLKSSPHYITISYNDVVCGKGKTTSSLVGNQRYKVWVNLHKEAFAKAFYDEERRQIARSIVNAVATSVPQGRFLSLDIHSGEWYDVGYERAVGITWETLMAESGMMNHRRVAHPPVERLSSIHRVFTSKAA